MYCKIDIEENSKCKNCCLKCNKNCITRCIFSKFNNFENGIKCNNETKQLK